jgi:Predicted SPOUT methyltransferase.
VKITIVSEQKVKSSFVRDAMEEYRKRLQPYTKIEYQTVHLPEGRLSERAYIIRITPGGEFISSEALAETIEGAMSAGYSRIFFFLNGAPLPRWNQSISISQMDFEPEILVMILYEQIYRAFTLIKGIPYHK